MQTSPRRLALIGTHKGNPLTCYLDPAVVRTIGHRFTMRSPAVRKVLAMLGITKLQPGKTNIAAAQSDATFEAVLRDKVAPAVTLALPQGRIVRQHMFDAISSRLTISGPAFNGRRWKTPWAAENYVRPAARIWADIYNTAAGKSYPALFGAVAKRPRFSSMASVRAGRQSRKPRQPNPRCRVETFARRRSALNKAGLPVKVDGSKTRAALPCAPLFRPDGAERICRQQLVRQFGQWA